MKNDKQLMKFSEKVVLFVTVVRGLIRNFIWVLLHKLRLGHWLRSDSKLAHHYLDGLNGIEIGASRQNWFGLEEAGGAYATVDFDVSQGGKWQDKSVKPVQVNIVSSGDNLPFKDATLDYVLSSHVIEHFFDPIQALLEWHRVIRKGGYVFMVVPHKDRTFDKDRDVTPLSELIDRHEGRLTISDYAYPGPNAMEPLRLWEGKNRASFAMTHLLIGKNNPPPGWIRFSEDDHHHWSVWQTEGFLELCQHLNVTIVEYQDPDDKVGNGFTVVMTQATINHLV
jgi:SAM-dependent methyltransferase